jgi:hypothetical protein
MKIIIGNTIAVLILSGLFSLLFACGETPEQLAKLEELKAEITKASESVAEALAMPLKIQRQLEKGIITPLEFDKLMQGAEKSIKDAQKAYQASREKFDEAKAAGLTTLQVVTSVAGGTFGRSILHAVTAYLSGMGGVAGMVGGLASVTLGGSGQRKKEQ